MPWAVPIDALVKFDTGGINIRWSGWRFHYPNKKTVADRLVRHRLLHAKPEKENHMKKIVSACCLLLALSTSALAAPPSDASLSQLMAITNMKQMLTDTYAQIDAMMESMVKQDLKGKRITPAQQTALNNLEKKMSALFKKEYTWEKLEPKFREIYKGSFTQEEVDGMITFYQSPAGEAVIKKMPVVMQHTMEFMQSEVQTLMPQMQKIQQEFTAELKAAEKK